MVLHALGKKLKLFLLIIVIVRAHARVLARAHASVSARARAHASVLAQAHTASRAS